MRARPDFGATVLFIPLTLILCLVWGVRPNFALLRDYALPWLIKLVIIVIATFILYFVVMAVTGQFAKARQEPIHLKGFWLNSLLLLAMAWVYTHIKAGVLLGTQSWDATFYQWDCQLFAGHEPWVVVRNLIPAIFGEALSVVYMLLYPMIVGSILWLTLIRRGSTANALTCAVVLNYYLGVLAYHLMPAYGPCYFIESGSSAGVSQLSHYIQNRLAETTALVQAAPGNATILPWVYIAAFPSLHISLAMILYWYNRHSRASRWLFGSFAVLTAISTVYLGWHYVVDWLGGIVIAVAAIWLTSRLLFSEK